jgi:hypothetical protein
LNADTVRRLITAAVDGEPHAQAELARQWAEIVALCCVDPSARLALDDLADRVETLDVEGADWIGLVLRVLHEEPFVAIEPATRAGIAGRMSGIVDNFQLHTLLMASMPGPGRRVSASAASIARGEGEQQSDETIVGAWNLYVHEAFRDGTLPSAGDPQAIRHLFIWNEGTPADIPVLDGHRVILLGEPSYERVWESARTFPHLPATLDARELSDDEVSSWLERLSRS